MAQNGKRYEVRGTVTGHNGAFLRGARVVVWWQHIRDRKELAAGETSEHGKYHLEYEIPEHAAPVPTKNSL
jgi:hypothetical protein